MVQVVLVELVCCDAGLALAMLMERVLVALVVVLNAGGSGAGGADAAPEYEADEGRTCTRALMKSLANIMKC